MEAKLIQGIERRDYFALTCDDGEPLESQSQAKAGIKSKWHYYKANLDPDRPPKKITDDMIRGTLGHELALEDKKSFESFNGTRKGRDWENFKLRCEREDIYPITDQSGKINERDLMGAAAAAKEALAELGADADQECAIIFEQYGVKCKSLLDKFSADATIYDLKFTEKIEPDEFMYHAFDLGWDFQCAWYKNAVKKLLGLEYDPQFVFVTVQPTYPYDWNHHILHGNAVEIAAKRVEKALRHIREGRETGDWSHNKREMNLIEAPLKFYDLED